MRFSHITALPSESIFDISGDSGFSAGTWVSNVDFGDNATYELDVYFGYAFETEAGLGIDISYVDFMYPGATNLDFQEIGIALSYGDAGLGYYSGQDGAPDYMDVSYAIGDISFSYGDYEGHFANQLRKGGSTQSQYATTAAHRDFSSWYHVVYVWDTDNGTQADRFIVYVNGVRADMTQYTGTVSGITGYIGDCNTLNIGK